MKVVVFVLLLVGCMQKKESKPSVKVDMEEVKDTFEALPPFLVDPSDPIVTSKQILGKKLYFETALSQANNISCNSCHMLDKYGVDNEPTSPGHKGQRGDRNSPTVYNAGLHLAQFWDGRAEDLKAQAKGPITNPIEMAIVDEKAAVKRVKEIKSYIDLFKASYPKQKDPVTYDNIADAIATFEMNLLTPSRFDDFLNGDSAALGHAEKNGLNTFMEVGCTSCHNGVAIGGGMYQKLGLEVAYPTKDLGRYNVTKDEEDKYFFKVPSLRNVEKTAPYFHDGSIETLEQAVTLMGKHQLGLDLKKQQINDITTFLKSLTGRLPNDVANL
jgi:cytochrome c peroxidase